MTDLADFAPDEIDRIRTIVIELRKSERSRQKTLRAELRGMGFRISDYRQSGAPFTVVDFDELVARVRSGRRSETHPLAQASAPAPRRAPMPHGDEPALALSAARAVGTANAVETVPRSPGLYAVHGDEAVWRELGLGPPPDSRPLYVGKSEHDLRSRDVRTHFRTGRTGSSTLRRSLGALLHEPLGLNAVPRNPARPERFQNYGLAAPGDARLTEWMGENLRLAVWVSSASVALTDIEDAVLSSWEPPLNLRGIRTRWTTQLLEARARMADEARRSVTES